MSFLPAVRPQKGVGNIYLAQTFKPSVLYFPFRQTTPISASERHSMNTTQQPVAVVTGASSGIGLGMTQALLERGWRVVGTSPHDQPLEGPQVFA
jgi:hypothetical protein